VKKIFIVALESPNPFFATKLGAEAKILLHVKTGIPGYQGW
jgi:hypothetical protein